MKKKKMLVPGSLFGELTQITGKKWKHATVFALESCSVIVFSSQINKILKVSKYKKDNYIGNL